MEAKIIAVFEKSELLFFFHIFVENAILNLQLNFQKQRREESMKKMISWNVNGLRACVKKGFFDFFTAADCDALCLQ